MLEALSLKTGEILDAQSVRHEAYRRLLPICPQCGEPVHLRRRERPYLTPYFAHHKELEAKKLVHACPLRVAGAELARASSVVQGIRQGQLVDRFQRECCREVHALFGREARTLIDFIEESQFLPLDRRDYTGFISAVSNSADPQRLFDGLGITGKATSSSIGLDDVDLFLQSSYGKAVGNFIFQSAYFIAVMAHPDAIDKELGWTYYVVGKKFGVFPVETWRIRSWSRFTTDILASTSPRNKAVPRIAATIITLVLMRWKGVPFGGSLIIKADAVSSGEVGGNPVAPLKESQLRSPQAPPPTEPSRGVTHQGFKSNLDPLNWKSSVIPEQKIQPTAEPLASSDQPHTAAWHPFPKSDVNRARVHNHAPSSFRPGTSADARMLQDEKSHQATSRPTIKPPGRTVPSPTESAQPRVTWWRGFPSPAKPALTSGVVKHVVREIVKAEDFKRHPVKVSWPPSSSLGALAFRSGTYLNDLEIEKIATAVKHIDLSLDGNYSKRWVFLEKSNLMLDLKSRVVFNSNLVKELANGVQITLEYRCRVVSSYDILFRTQY